MDEVEVPETWNPAAKLVGAKSAGQALDVRNRSDDQSIYPQDQKGALEMMYDRFSYYPFGPLPMLLLAVLVIVPFWQVFSKAGYSGWWSLLMIVPVVNLIALYVLAFSNWPALRRTT